ncbi:MAG: hypothetical protein JXA98_01075 [Methanosarcinaceae archaeon]|nr:hypothetical protein [Methanosarcinaceae archaeon]
MYFLCGTVLAKGRRWFVDTERPETTVFIILLVSGSSSGDAEEISTTIRERASTRSAGTS